MQSTRAWLFGAVSLALSLQAEAQPVGVGPAPGGDALAVATRVIGENFPECKRASQAVRARDGSIRARCSGTDYLVFTLHDPKERKTHEVALNCTAAKRLLKVEC